jgi:hypothetical protein
VIEIPETPIEIVDHVLVARRCGVCGRVHIPTLSAADGVVGKGRVGVRLTGLVPRDSQEDGPIGGYRSCWRGSMGFISPLERSPEYSTRWQGMQRHGRVDTQEDSR